jgi:hypothetical protein
MAQPYLGYKLTDAERLSLLAQFPPSYPRVLADHVTIQLTAPETLPQADEIALLGMADNDAGGQALVVAIDGERLRSDGQPYHLTWSVDPEQGVRPWMSGGMVVELETKNLIAWFSQAVILPGRQAVWDDRSGPDRTDPAPGL